MFAAEVMTFAPEIATLTGKIKAKVAHIASERAVDAT
jgi:hypothetical protein